MHSFIHSCIPGWAPPAFHIANFNGVQAIAKEQPAVWNKVDLASWLVCLAWVLCSPRCPSNQAAGISNRMQAPCVATTTTAKPIYQTHTHTRTNTHHVCRLVPLPGCVFLYHAHPCHASVHLFALQSCAARHFKAGQGKAGPGRAGCLCALRGAVSLSGVEWWRAEPTLFVLAIAPAGRLAGVSGSAFVLGSGGLQGGDGIR